jgi:aminoglycoside phosphotransferase (APT) family kinase protein
MPETTPIRAGEELDTERLGAYLRTTLARSGDMVVRQFPAGSSNLTYLVVLGKDEFVLRRPPFGNTVKTAHDMKREYGVLSKLSAVYPPAPNPLLFCDDTSIIGSEFYLMERRRGLIIRGPVSSPRVGSPHVSKGSACNSTQTELLNMSQDFRLRVCNSFVRNLADLHALDYSTAGLADLGHPDGYARRQVEGWSRRYFAAKTDQHPQLEETIVWLNKNIPDDSGAALVHNDYKFDNIMLDPDDLTRITAVLDWEMVTIGDPLLDLGTTLGYWMSPDAGDALLNMPFNPRVLMENISRRHLVEMYAAASGRDVSNILYYYVFGTFKIAVIAQQIYARFVKGYTKDERFASFAKFVAALGHISAKAIERGTI